MTPPCYSTLDRCVAAVLAVIGWSALAIEFHFLLGDNPPLRIAHAAVQFLSFFTVISNLLVAIILTTRALRPAAQRAGMGAARVAAATVVYILMTGLVYTLFLRQSHGNVLGWVVDIVLHLLMPVAYPLFWMAMMPKRRLVWRDACVWLTFPLAFALASMVRGAITGEYTYAFLNADRLGYVRVVLIVVGLSLPFLGLGIIVVKVNGSAAAKGRSLV